MKRNTEEMYLEIGLGLTVQLSPEEAGKILPKIKKDLELKIERREKEILGIEKLRQGFLKQLELYENMQDGMVNVGGVGLG